MRLESEGCRDSDVWGPRNTPFGPELSELIQVFLHGKEKKGLETPRSDLTGLGLGLKMGLGRRGLDLGLNQEKGRGSEFVLREGGIWTLNLTEGGGCGWDLDSWV